MKTLQANINEALFGGFDTNRAGKNLEVELWTKKHIYVENWNNDEPIKVEYSLDNQGNIVITPKERAGVMSLIIDDWNATDSRPLDISKLSKCVKIWINKLAADNFKGMFADIIANKTVQIYIDKSKHIKNFEGLENLNVNELSIDNSQIDSFNFCPSLTAAKDAGVMIDKCKINSFSGFPKVNGIIDINDCTIGDMSGSSIITQDNISLENNVYKNGIQNATIQGQNVNLDGKLKSLSGTTIIAKNDIELFNGDSSVNASAVNFTGFKAQSDRLYLYGIKFEDCKDLPKLNNYNFKYCEIQSFEGLPQNIRSLDVQDCHVNLNELDWETIPKVNEFFTWYYNSNTGKNKQKTPKDFKAFIEKNKCTRYTNIQ
jgi:hypothetical protein